MVAEHSDLRQRLGEDHHRPLGDSRIRNENRLAVASRFSFSDVSSAVLGLREADRGYGRGRVSTRNFAISRLTPNRAAIVSALAVAIFTGSW